MEPNAKVAHYSDSSGLDSLCGDYSEYDDDLGICTLEEDVLAVTCYKCGSIIIHKLLANLGLSPR